MGAGNLDLPHLSSDAIVELRPTVPRPMAGHQPLEFHWEQEAAGQAEDVADVLTVFLVGGECSFRCVMCDLWKYTHPGKTPVGAIPAQLSYALRSAGGADKSKPWIKLYNASNFFAPNNVPFSDLPRIAGQLDAFERVIVENHPKLVRRQVHEFGRMLRGKLEIAMGLETAHPKILSSLNKGMDLDDFRLACDRLLSWDIDVRAFVLLRPPGLDETSGIEWCTRSIEFAQRCGVRHVSIIPVRGGNGAIDYLQQSGIFQPPLASSLEMVMQSNLPRNELVLTADLWDWGLLSGTCTLCRDPRRKRLEEMNLQQAAGKPLDTRCDCGRPEG